MSTAENSVLGQLPTTEGLGLSVPWVIMKLVWWS